MQSRALPQYWLILQKYRAVSQGATAASAPWPPLMEASESHYDTPQSVGLLWTSDRPEAESRPVVFWCERTSTNEAHQWNATVFNDWQCALLHVATTRALSSGNSNKSFTTQKHTNKNLHNLNVKQQIDVLLVSRTNLAFPRVSGCLLTP